MNLSTPTKVIISCTDKSSPLYKLNGQLIIAWIDDNDKLNLHLFNADFDALILPVEYTKDLVTYKLAKSKNFGNKDWLKFMLNQELDGKAIGHLAQLLSPNFDGKATFNEHTSLYTLYDSNADAYVNVGPDRTMKSIVKQILEYLIDDAENHGAHQYAKFIAKQLPHILKNIQPK